jgi:uncharacterized protein (UPF0218 family)
MLALVLVPPAEHLVTLGNLQKGCVVWEIEGAFDRRVLRVLETLDLGSE